MNRNTDLSISPLNGISSQFRLAVTTRKRMLEIVICRHGILALFPPRIKLPKIPRSDGHAPRTLNEKPPDRSIITNHSPDIHQ